MLRKATIQWTIKQLNKFIGQNKVTFDNAVQRHFVWDNSKCSLLIHSILKGFPIPPFFAAKNEDKYDMLDGLQRSTAISLFLNDGFALCDVPEIQIETADENGDEVVEILDINGLKFSELSEDIQDSIKDATINVVYFDGITDDEISEMFFRLNNGKPLSAIELTRVKAKSREAITEIAKHEIFTNALTEKALKNYTNEDIVIKSWLILNEENPSFLTAYVRKRFAEVEITTSELEEINIAFTRILDSFKYLVSTATTDTEKLIKKISKRILGRTHLVSLVPFALDSVNKGYSAEDFAEWAKSFFSGTARASISVIYNDCAGTGSASPDKVTTRNRELEKSYKAFFAANNVDEMEI